MSLSLVTTVCDDSFRLTSTMLDSGQWMLRKTAIVFLRHSENYYGDNISN
jgi:hypothetical protein